MKKKIMFSKGCEITGGMTFTKNAIITKGWWMTEHDGVQLWHYKKGPRSMTKLYRTKAHMIAEHPELVARKP
jgi:hypothetical protein